MTDSYVIRCQGGQMTEQDMRIAATLVLVERELRRALVKFPVPFHNAHEGYAVLLEEVDELWDEIKANRADTARKEAVQVAAMAVRFLLEVK